MFIATQRLGTIEGTPAIVEPPTRNYASRSYKGFRDAFGMRDTMLMVPANDGILHAFILGSNGAKRLGAHGYGTDDYKWMEKLWYYGAYGQVTPPFLEGDELWGFIPRAMWPKMRDLLNFGPQTMIAASPTVADVEIGEDYHFRTLDGEYYEKTYGWGTVIVGGYGGGARGYYALDITNPGRPQILWEIDHLWHMNGRVWPDYYADAYKRDAYDFVDLDMDVKQRRMGIDYDYPLQLMGYSSAKPVITNMVIDGRIEPVAILAGGRQPTETTEPKNRIGKVLYVVRLYPHDFKQLLVKAFYFEHEIIGTPAVFPSGFNTVAQMIYVGDSNSALYRLDVSNGNPYKWGSYEKLKTEDSYVVEKPIFDPARMKSMGASSSNPEHSVTSPYAGITYKPALSVYKYGQKPVIQITVATGSNENINPTASESNYVGYFYDVWQDNHYVLNPPDFVERAKILVFNPPKGVHEKEKVEEDKQIFDIYTRDPISHRVLDKLQKPTGAPITYNFVSYFPTYITQPGTCNSGRAAIWKLEGGSNHKNYTTTTQGVQNLTAKESDTFNGNSLFKLDMGTKIYGLEITRTNYCSKDGDPDGSKMVAPMLVAQTGGEATSINNDAGTGHIKSATASVQSFELNLDAITPTTRTLSWASVYE